MGEIIIPAVHKKQIHSAVPQHMHASQLLLMSVLQDVTHVLYINWQQNSDDMCIATIMKVDTSGSQVYSGTRGVCAFQLWVDCAISPSTNQVRHLAYFTLLDLIVLHAAQFPTRIKVYLISCQHWLSKATEIMTVVSGECFHLNLLSGQLQLILVWAFEYDSHVSHLRLPWSSLDSASICQTHWLQ